MKKVTDPALLAELEGSPVVDPAILAQLQPEMAGKVPLQPYDPNTSLRRPAEFASGFNKGLANIVGVPVDLMAWGLRKAGVDVSQPVGGSDYMLGRMAQAGMLGMPTDTTGRVLNRVGQEVGATAVPTAGLLAGARYAQPVLNRFPGLLDTMLTATRAAPGAVAAADVGLATTSGMGAATAREIYPNNPTAELLGQFAGGLGPASVAAGTRAAFRGGESGRQVLAQNMDVFRRANVDPTVGQAAQSVRTQGIENVLAKAPGSVTVMHRAAERASNQLKASVARIADGYGPQASAEQAGRTIERGIAGFTKRFQAKSEALYNALDDYIQPGKVVPVLHTRTTLDRLTAPIQGAENLSGILANPKIAQIHKAFTNDAGEAVSLPYQAIKELRSQVGRMLSSSELITEAPKAQLKQLYKALSQDMESAAKIAGPQAAKAFSRANTYYKAGVTRIDDSLQTLASKARPEDVFLAATKGKEGATTVRTIRRSLKPEEWDTVASTVLRRMGRSKNSLQDDLGEVFSVETFLTNWNALAPEARSAMFGGSRYGRMAKDLEAVAGAASKIREASRVLANPSGTTGQGANWAAWASGLTGMATGNLEIPATVLAVSGMSHGASRLMTSPKFVRWLAQSTKVPVERLPGYVSRLSVVLKGEDPETIDAAQEYLDAFKGANQ